MFIVIFYIAHCQFTANVLSRFKRKLTTAIRMSEDLDELFLSPIPAPTPVELQQCILFGFRRRLNPDQILDECRSAFGPFAPTAQYVARWYQRFQDGLFAIDAHDDDDNVEEEWCAGIGAGAGRGQTPTTCSDYNDDDDIDNDHGLLPLVLNDLLGHGHSDKDSYNNDDDDCNHDKADHDELIDDGHVISYWQGYGYLGGKSGMSISGLPPLPKSLSGFNKLLGSDSGLLSDVELQQELNNNNNNNNDNKENDSGNKLASQIVSDNNKSNNNNNNLSGDKQASKDSSKDNANDKSATATAESATATTTPPAKTFNANENENTSTTATATTAIATTTTPSSPAKLNVTGSTLDAQIATLRKEMYGLRQLDLSLLSQLWALNDSIQEFRTMIEEQEDEDDDGDVDDDDDAELDEMGNRRHSPTPSSYDSVSSEGGADAELVMQAKAKRLGTIPKVITTQPKQQQKQQLQPRGDLKPLPRMRSAPPPPPPVALMCTARKAAAPPRPT
ncbi:myb-like protein U isoform X3 [Drosophila novamexicana]|uniref:myb-like protein U isoform X3 n=1 Tax=Drosophila novamexicana TaxID=47314 RepID=UPI0011E5BB2E|nr:myb-like protein U isoform X3 [Drosophila novamexicana]